MGDQIMHMCDASPIYIENWARSHGFKYVNKSTGKQIICHGFIRDYFKLNDDGYVCQPPDSLILYISTTEHNGSGWDSLYLHCDEVGTYCWSWDGEYNDATALDMYDEMEKELRKIVELNKGETRKIWFKMVK
jgi:hypothetical protein